MRTVLGVIVLCCGLSASALDIGPPIPLPEAPAVQTAAPSECPCGPGCTCGPDCPCRQSIQPRKSEVGAATGTLVIVKASWCGKPCADMQSAAKGIPHKTLDYDADAAEVARLFAKAKAEYKAPDGRPATVPVAFVVNPDGTAARWWRGAATADELSRFYRKGNP